MDSAEAHGGQAFRTLHPNAEVQLFLGPSIMEQLGMASSKPTQPKGHLLRRSWTLPEKNPDFPPVTSQGNPVWNVIYSDPETSDMFFLVLDPITAKLISSWPPSPTSARANLEIANAKATLWAQDSRLIAVIGNQVMAPEGLNTFWSYIYRSATRDSCWVVIAGGGAEGQVSFAGPYPFTLPSVEPLPSHWVDSPEVLALCEANGGSAYRSAHPETQVEAYLGYGFYSENPQIPVWWIQYMAQNGFPTLEFFIHAETGQLLTDVNNPEPLQELLDSYALGQNFPNPFNPTTTIPYAVKTSGRVKITVHDLEGRVVETLVDAFHAPGMYHIQVNGENWASGIYFYRIQVNGFEEVRKMILMR